ncbi:MAG TPA: hypothetical protein VK735_39720 [Pseudonocardia sp.]|uniref:hypothetical protein n=1 Tax=Pseudonocardia sp. TaxID=60912 RepID=UPI002BD6467C|nr:hypothetical protein [Pseudonocardia sp.]HTF53612.1 hypothetical protein [Pseudonocardia sp.]
MVRRVKFEILCGRHLVEFDEEVEGTEIRTDTIGGIEIVTDLCKQCDSGWYEPFMAALRKAGVKSSMLIAAPTSTGGKPNMLDCPVCPNKYKQVSTNRGHIRDVHPDFWDSPAGQTYHASSRATRSTERSQCPYCPDQPLGPQALGMHKAKRHPKEFAREKSQRQEIMAS